LVPAPYQASIRLYDNYNKNDDQNTDSFTLCSGAIVHPFFIAVSAHCMYSHSISHQISRPLMPNMCYIVAGNSSGPSAAIEHINSIFVHPSYDEKRMVNDIALVKLEKPLNLTNPDLQWLELADNSTKSDNCFACFNNVGAKANYPYRAAEPNTVLDNFFCSNKQSNNATRDADICAYYSFSDSFMCKVSENQLKISNDRGTPLICNNKLMAILSQILLPSNSTANSTCTGSLKTTAYYTRVAPYSEWIHNVIGVNLPTGAGGEAVPVKPETPAYQAPAPTTPAGTPTKPVRGSATIPLISSFLLLSAIAVTLLIVTHFN